MKCYDRGDECQKVRDRWEAVGRKARCAGTSDVKSWQDLNGCITECTVMVAKCCQQRPALLKHAETCCDRFTDWPGRASQRGRSDWAEFCWRSMTMHRPSSDMVLKRKQIKKTMEINKLNT